MGTVTDVLTLEFGRVVAGGDFKAWGHCNDYSALVMDAYQYH